MNKKEMVIENEPKHFLETLGNQVMGFNTRKMPQLVC